jgi:hypothetical protein
VDRAERLARRARGAPPDEGLRHAIRELGLTDPRAFAAQFGDTLEKQWEMAASQGVS